MPLTAALPFLPLIAMVGMDWIDSTLKRTLAGLDKGDPNKHRPINLIEMQQLEIAFRTGCAPFKWPFRVKLIECSHPPDIAGAVPLAAIPPRALLRLELIAVEDGSVATWHHLFAPRRFLLTYAGALRRALRPDSLEGFGTLIVGKDVYKALPYSASLNDVPSPSF